MCECSEGVAYSLEAVSVLRSSLIAMGDRRESLETKGGVKLTSIRARARAQDRHNENEVLGLGRINLELNG